MKTITLFLFASLLAFVVHGNPERAFELSAKVPHFETVSFTVSGNCNMCKNRIEKAVNELEGVQSAVWNVETKIITVVYNPHKLSLTAIHQTIADAGHDTDLVKANTETYQSLPGCCQYDRPDEQEKPKE